VHPYDSISLISSYNKKGFKQILQKKSRHILCSKLFSPNSCRLWENVEEYGTGGQATNGNTIWCMRCACWINKAANTPSEYVIFNAFPRQKCLHERASILRLYVLRLSCLKIRLWQILNQEASSTETRLDFIPQKKAFRVWKAQKQGGRKTNFLCYSKLKGCLGTHNVTIHKPRFSFWRHCHLEYPTCYCCRLLVWK